MFDYDLNIKSSLYHDPPKPRLINAEIWLGIGWEEFSGTVKLNGLSVLIYANERRENAYELLEECLR